MDDTPSDDTAFYNTPANDTHTLYSQITSQHYPLTTRLYPSTIHPLNTASAAAKAAKLAAEEEERNRIKPYFALIDDSLYNPSRLLTEKLQKTGYDKWRIQKFLRDQVVANNPQPL